MAAVPPDVSFVVIAHDEEGTIGRCLAAIVAQDAAVRWEVVVVDDGSRDHTAERAVAVPGLDSRLDVVRLPVNRGRGHARRVGSEAAQGRLVAFVDADIVLPADWLTRCLTEIEGRDAVGGTAVPDGDLAYVHRRSGLKPKVVGQTTVVTGSNGLYRRELFNRVAFDSTLREGEDVALNFALAAGGARVHTVPGLLVRHEEAKAFGESIAWLFDTGRGASRQLLRYRVLRLPDLVYGGWLVTSLLSLRGCRRWGWSAWLAPAYLLAVACGHVGRAFEMPGLRQADRVVVAVATDTAMLSAYFVGRTVGLIEYRRELRGSAHVPGA